LLYLLISYHYTPIKSVSQPFAFGLHVAGERISNPIIKNPSKSAVDHVLRSIIN